MEKKDRVLEYAIYIEAHLKEELSVKCISAWAGYSPWYFSRCFKETMGIPLMEYVKQRRLFAAAEEIRRGKRIIDAALEYGWETHGGFTKAFSGQFGYSPVLLKAFCIHAASIKYPEYVPGLQKDREKWKGELDHMELYIKMPEPYKEPEELWEMLCFTFEKNGAEYNRRNVRSAYELAASTTCAP